MAYMIARSLSLSAHTQHRRRNSPPTEQYHKQHLLWIFVPEQLSRAWSNFLRYDDGLFPELIPHSCPPPSLLSALAVILCRKKENIVEDLVASRTLRLTCKNTSMAFLSSRANHCAGLSRGGDDGAAAAPGGEAPESLEVPAEARRGGGDALVSPGAEPSRTTDNASGGLATTKPSETVPRSSPVEDDAILENSGGRCQLFFRSPPPPPSGGLRCRPGCEACRVWSAAAGVRFVGSCGSCFIFYFVGRVRGNM